MSIINMLVYRCTVYVSFLTFLYIVSSYCAFNINHSLALNFVLVIRRNEILRQVAPYQVYFSLSDTKAMPHLLTVIILVHKVKGMLGNAFACKLCGDINLNIV